MSIFKRRKHRLGKRCTKGRRGITRVGQEVVQVVFDETLSCGFCGLNRLLVWRISADPGGIWFLVSSPGVIGAGGKWPKAKSPVREVVGGVCSGLIHLHLKTELLVSCLMSLGVGQLWGGRGGGHSPYQNIRIQKNERHAWYRRQKAGSWSPRVASVVDFLSLILWQMLVISNTLATGSVHFWTWVFEDLENRVRKRSYNTFWLNPSFEDMTDKTSFLEPSFDPQSKHCIFIYLLELIFPVKEGDIVSLIL